MNGQGEIDVAEAAGDNMEARGDSVHRDSVLTWQKQLVRFEHYLTLYFFELSLSAKFHKNGVKVIYLDILDQF